MLHCQRPYVVSIRGRPCVLCDRTTRILDEAVSRCACSSDWRSGNTFKSIRTLCCGQFPCLEFPCYVSWTWRGSDLDPTNLADFHGNLDIHARHLRILHASSCRLVVQLKCDGLQLIFLIGHAPSNVPDDEYRTWWTATTAAIPHQLRHVPTIGLIDANPRVGEFVSEHVGGHQPQAESSPGTIFHQWLQDFDMYAPQTFADFHVGEGNTWFHASGSAARLDYVVLSQCLRSCQVRTSVAEVDLALQKLDHVAVQVDIYPSSSPAVRTGIAHLTFTLQHQSVMVLLQTLSGELMCIHTLPHCSAGCKTHSLLAPRLFEERAT